MRERIEPDGVEHQRRLDEQTVGGKLMFEVATRARQGGVPCYAVVGKDDLDAFEHRLMNIEVEAAARNGAVASVAAVENAARRVARRLLGTVRRACAR